MRPSDSALWPAGRGRAMARSAAEVHAQETGATKSGGPRGLTTGSARSILMTRPTPVKLHSCIVATDPAGRCWPLLNPSSNEVDFLDASADTMTTNANSRLEVFCDGVFAIAITLLAFVLSFGIIFISWVNHHEAR